MHIHNGLDTEEQMPTRAFVVVGENTIPVRSSLDDIMILITPGSMDISSPKKLVISDSLSNLISIEKFFAGLEDEVKVQFPHPDL